MTGLVLLAIAGMAMTLTASTTSADRHVDPERPAPGQVVGEEAAKQRSDPVVTPNTAPKRACTGHVRRKGITSPIHAIAVTMMAPPPMPCSARAADQHRHRARKANSTDPARKNSSEDLEHDLAAEHVAELADDGGAISSE